jgi:23S rRNA pseudouridine1911/1915/1917 synthase
MLHAYQLAFIHPRSGKRMHFEAPVPKDFEDMLKALR